MGQTSKQAGLLFSFLISVLPYTMIATFFPGIAVSKGIPLWLIGLIYSTEPIFGLIASALMGKYLISIGRKTTILIGLVSVAASSFLLAPIEYFDADIILILSFSSRVFAGWSIGTVLTTGVTIMVSDYPEAIQKMIGRMESAVGIGVIIGPLFGMLLYLGELIYTLTAYGILMLILIPVISKLLGTFREYKVENTNLKTKELIRKPVLFI